MKILKNTTERKNILLKIKISIQENYNNLLEIESYETFKNFLIDNINEITEIEKEEHIRNTFLKCSYSDLENKNYFPVLISYKENKDHTKKIFNSFILDNIIKQITEETKESFIYLDTEN